MKTILAALLLIAIGGIGTAIMPDAAPADAQNAAPTPEDIFGELDNKKRREARRAVETRNLARALAVRAGEPQTYSLVETPAGLVQLNTTDGSATLLNRNDDGRLESQSISAPPARNSLTYKTHIPIDWSEQHFFVPRDSKPGTFEVISGKAGTLLHDTRSGAIWQLEETDGKFVWASTDPDKPRPGDAWLGISTRDIDEGIRITAVAHGSAAATVGLRANDLIREVDGQPASGDVMRKVLKEKQPGESIKLKIERAGVTFTLEITLGEYK